MTCTRQRTQWHAGSNSILNTLDLSLQVRPIPAFLHSTTSAVSWGNFDLHSYRPCQEVHFHSKLSYCPKLFFSYCDSVHESLDSVSLRSFGFDLTRHHLNGNKAVVYVFLGDYLIADLENQTLFVLDQARESIFDARLMLGHNLMPIKSGENPGK